MTSRTEEREADKAELAMLIGILADALARLDRLGLDVAAARLCHVIDTLREDDT